MNAEQDKKDDDVGDVTISEVTDFTQTIPGAIAAEAISTAQEYMRLADRYHKRASDLLVSVICFRNYAITARRELIARGLPTPMALELIISEASALIEQFKKQRKEAKGT